MIGPVIVGAAAVETRVVPGGRALVPAVWLVSEGAVAAGAAPEPGLPDEAQAASSATVRPAMTTATTRADLVSAWLFQRARIRRPP